MLRWNSGGNVGLQDTLKLKAIILPVFLLAASVSADGTLGEVDPNTLSCDPDGQISLLLPHFTDCTKFYMCAHGNEVEFTCPSSLHFDFGLQTCNWPRDTECILRVVPEDIDEEGSGSGDDDVDWLTEKEDNPTDADTDEVSEFASSINCLNADSAAKQIVYKGDCQRYWRCIEGVPQVVYCSDGLFFNDRTQQCDFEANVKCLVEEEDEFNNEFIKVNLKA